MENRKVSIGSVSYLNSKPLLYGFEQGMMKDDIDLQIGYPSAIARQLLEDTIDLGLVPVAIIPQLKEYHIVSDYCIGCDGEVATVCLFSDVPLEDIQTILLDYQSRTSVELLKLLLKEHWKISPVLLDTGIEYEKKIGGTTAGLVIGDRAFVQHTRSKYIYDLGTAWKDMTGLPFVFAAWVSNKKLPDLFVTAFNKTTGIGIDHVDEIVQKNMNCDYDLRKYYKLNISYILDYEKRKALDIFLKTLRTEGHLSSKIIE